MEVVSKDIIEQYITPHLSKGKRGPESSVALWQLVQAILYRLKTGCQWRMMPLRSFFEHDSLTWEGVYYHHRKWVQDGSWKVVWVELLKAHHDKLDLSCVQLDGSHTLCKKQGEQIAYQGRKSGRTTNALFLVDSTGQPLVMSTPQAGNHHDLFEIEPLFEEMCGLLKEAGIDMSGVFLNADSGFDSKGFREECVAKEIEANIAVNERNRKESAEEYVYFDAELYKYRFVVERTNAWIDGFKTLLVRYEGLIKTWIADHLMAFTILFLRKINTC